MNPIKYLITFTIGMLPVIESRGAIAFAVGILKMNVWQAYAWSTLGNITVIALILKFLDPVSQWLMLHSAKFKHFLTNLFEKTRTQHSLKFNEIGALLLVTIVALPFPGTGGWTGALIAFLFGVRFWTAFLLISVGVIIAGIFMTLGVTSLSAFLEMIKN